MAGRGAFTSSDGLVDSAAFPFQASDLEVAWLEGQAEWCRQVGGKVEGATGTAFNVWSGVKEHYDALEAPQLYQAMDPVQDRGKHESNMWFIAARKIDGYAHELAPLKQKLAALTVEIDAFRNSVAAGVAINSYDVERGRVTLEPAELAEWYDGAKTSGFVAWHQHTPTVERNQELIAEARRLFDQIETARAELERRLRELRDDADGQAGWGAGGHRPGQAGVDADDISWFAPDQDWFENATPEQVREWWDGLDAWQRAALIAGMPLVIGNLNGIPLATRAEANEINIRNEAARIEAEIENLDRQIAAGPPPGGSFGGYLAHLDALKEQRAAAAEALASYKGYLNLQDMPDDIEFRERLEYDENGAKTVRTSVNVIAFDPSKSVLATYYGTYDANGDIPADMRNVLVHSPGMGTDTVGFRRTDESLYNIYFQANQRETRLESGGSTAVIAWAGGVYPQAINEALDSKYYYDLGPKFHEFVDGGVNPPDDARLTVTGHSYGGAIVATAEKDGLRPDAVVYVSAAGYGMGMDSVKDLGTENIPHYSMMVRNDNVTGPIQENFIHGGSPIHDGQYVLRLESGTDAAGAPLEDSGRFWDSHSAIYYNESTGQANIVGVATATQVEVYAPGGTVGNRYGGVTWRNGIELPDYEANLIDVDDWENQPPQIREQP